MPRQRAASVAAESASRRRDHVGPGRIGEHDREGGVAVPAVDLGAAVDGDDVTGAERAVAGDAVHHVVVDRDAERVPVARHELEVRSPAEARG